MAVAKEIFDERTKGANQSHALREDVKVNDGRSVTPEPVRKAIAEELEKPRVAARFESARFEPAAGLFEQITTGADLPEFMTPAAYEHID